MQRRTAVVLVVVALLAPRLFWLIDAQEWRVLDSDIATGVLEVAIFVGVSIPALLAISDASVRPGFRQLGLDDGFMKGLSFGVVATLPMAFVAVTHPAPVLTVDTLAGNAMLGPFAEEVLFRGLLFMQLRRQARWPLPWALAVSALAFGVAHGLATQAMVATAAGLLFGWICERFQSLWPAIALHGLMNLWWMVARGQQVRVVLAVDPAGLAQIATIALAVALTQMKTGSPARDSP